MDKNDWNPADFEQVLEQRANEAAIQGCLDRLNAEYARNNLTFPQAEQDKMRLRLAYALRGKIKRRSVTPEEEGTDQ